MKIFILFYFLREIYSNIGVIFLQKVKEKNGFAFV